MLARALESGETGRCTHARLRVLRGGQDRLPDGLGQRDRAEQRLRIEIVLAGFIDDPDEAVLSGIGVAKCDVNFSGAPAMPDSLRCSRTRRVALLAILPWLDCQSRS
jgi:hypothetical protein